MELWGMVWDPNGEGWESSDCRLLQTTGGRWSACFAENRTDPHPTMEGALEALSQIPSMMQTVGRCLERQRRCRPGSKRYLELDAIITKYNGDVSHASSQVWMALQYSKPVQPDLGKCHFCGGKIVSGEDAHPGYTGWPYCEQCHAV